MNKCMKRRMHGMKILCEDMILVDTQKQPLFCTHVICKWHSLYPAEKASVSSLEWACHMSEPTVAVQHTQCPSLSKVNKLNWESACMDLSYPLINAGIFTALHQLCRGSWFFHKTKNSCYFLEFIHYSLSCQSEASSARLRLADI